LFWLIITSSLWFNTEDMTGIICILLVKWTIPSNPFNCCNDTMTAAPAINPTRVAFDRKSITNPNLQITSQNQLKIQQEKMILFFSLISIYKLFFYSLKGDIFFFKVINLCWVYTCNCKMIESHIKKVSKV
jgi:hypothetical protein